MMSDGRSGSKHTVSAFRRNQLLEMARISRIRWIVSELSQSSSPSEKKSVDVESKDTDDGNNDSRPEEIDRDIPGLDCLQDIFNFLVDVSREDRSEDYQADSNTNGGKDGSGKKRDVLEENDYLDVLSLVPTEEELLYANEIDEDSPDKDPNEEDAAFVEVHQYEDVECDDTCYKLFLDKLRRSEVIDIVRSIRRYVSIN